MNDRPRVTPLNPRSRHLANGRPTPAAPAWPLLIVILLVGIGLFALSDKLTPEGILRPITDSLMVVVMFVAMAAWVRANRPAMAQIDERAHEGSPIEIRYVASERHPLWRAEGRRRRRGQVRLKDAPQASPGAERRQQWQIFYSSD
jgi:hypothetical protein